MNELISCNCENCPKKSNYSYELPISDYLLKKLGVRKRKSSKTYFLLTTYRDLSFELVTEYVPVKILKVLRKEKILVVQFQTKLTPFLPDERPIDVISIREFNKNKLRMKND